jgi:C1A family cysteine protease
VYDQGNLGSCTANAIAAAYQFDHSRQKLGAFAPSRLFIYYNERVLENSVNSDDGATIRDGMKILGNGDKGIGVCSEWRWPYIISKFAQMPNDECYRVAKRDQALQYSTVRQVPAQLKGCLADGFPIVFGFTVYSSFMDIGSDGVMQMPQPYDNVEGGHAVLCVGYDDSKQSYIVRNSWGSKWGIKGYFYMPYNYMHNADLCDDFWSIRKVE